MRPNTLRTLRRYHHYIGMFFAPWILLFAVSGALQTFRLPDPPGAATWMKWLAAVHKDQGPPRAEKPRSTAPAGGAEHHHDADEHDGSKRPNPLPLKIFVVLLAIALACSTLIGVVIGLANRTMRKASIILLLAGTVIPPVLLWL